MISGSISPFSIPPSVFKTEAHATALRKAPTSAFKFLIQNDDLLALIRDSNEAGGSKSPQLSQHSFVLRRWAPGPLPALPVRTSESSSPLFWNQMLRVGFEDGRGVWGRRLLAPSIPSCLLLGRCPSSWPSAHSGVWVKAGGGWTHSGGRCGWRASAGRLPPPFQVGPPPPPLRFLK